MEIREFNQIVDQLQNYGRKGFEEIDFRESGGQLVPVAVERPNWFARLVRWIFQGEYKEADTAKKVLEFLKKNKMHILDKKDSIEHLKTILCERITNPKENQLIAAQFYVLNQQICNIAKKNLAFLDKSPPKIVEEKQYDAGLKKMIETLSQNPIFKERYSQNPAHFELVCKVLYPIDFNFLYENKKLNPQEKQQAIQEFDFFFLHKSSEDLAFILSIPEDEIGDKWQNYVVRKNDWKKMYQDSNQEMYGKMMHHNVKVASLLMEKWKSLPDIVDFLAMRRRQIAYTVNPTRDSNCNVGLLRSSPYSTRCQKDYAVIPEELKKRIEEKPHSSSILTSFSNYLMPKKNLKGTSSVELNSNDGSYLYKGKIGEDEIVLSKLHLHRGEEVSSWEILHTSPQNAEEVMKHVECHLYPELLKEKSHEILLEDLGRVFWWICQAKPWNLGDPSIAETLVRTILTVHGLESPPWKKNLIPWVEVMVEPDVNKFAKNFHLLFDWPEDWQKTFPE
jgi:hypothetical protein